MSAGPNTWRVRSGRLVLALVVAAVVAGGCGSSDDDSGAAGSGDTESSAPTASDATTTSVIVSESMRGERYCEVLLIRPATEGFTAEVFNSYPLNECPQEQWEALDAQALAAEAGAPIANLNGPRYWLMDRIDKVPGEIVQRDFGGIEMIQRATVNIPSLIEAMKPYAINRVNRETVFHFDAGRTVYEIVDDTGQAWVMQAWSQQIDPSLDEAGLATLGDRLQLPEGWSYRARTLTEPLDVVTTEQDAAVLQDELRNSYSRETSG